MTVLITGTGGVLIVTLVEKFTEGETDPREKPDERDMLARLLAERVQLAAEDDFGDFLFVRHRSAGVTCGERGQDALPSDLIHSNICGAGRRRSREGCHRC